MTPGGWSASKKKEIEVVLLMAQQWHSNLDILRNLEQVDPS